MIDYIITEFEDSWYKSLKSFLEGGAFERIGKTINWLRKKVIVYPEKELIFRAFRETPLDEVKVILLFQDPYHNGIMDGLATSCSKSFISPTLQIMLNEIDREYPEWKDLLDYGRYDRKNLLRWAKQGVLLLNVALTVEKGKPGSHLDIWKPFTIEVINILNEKQDLVWGLFGKEAQLYKKYIKNVTHSIFTVPHPAAEIYNFNAGFYDSNIFRNINEELAARNKKIIYW